MIRYLGGGAVAGSTAVYGLGNAFTQNAQAQVNLDFEDATIDLPEDDTIEDLRLTGDISGDFATGAGPSESVQLKLDVQFDRFGSFSPDPEIRQPDESQGSVSWQPTYSLVERTEFTGEGEDLQSASHDNNTVSYDVTAGVEIEVYADGSLVAESQDNSAGTITFRNPAPSETPENGTPENGTATEGESDADPEASVSTSFGFEVDK